MKIDVFAWLMTGFKILDKIESFVKQLTLTEKFKRNTIIIEFFSLLLITVMGYLSYAGYFPIYFGKLIMCFAFISIYLPQIVFATISVTLLYRLYPWLRIK